MDAVVKEQGKSDPFLFFLFTMRIRAQGARKVKLPCSLLGTAITIALKVPRTHEHTFFFLETDYFLTFCLRSRKVSLSDRGGAREWSTQIEIWKMIKRKLSNVFLRQNAKNLFFRGHQRKIKENEYGSYVSDVSK
jgi:hypothetical protein